MFRMRTTIALFVTAVLPFAGAGCGPGEDGGARFTPIDSSAATFWDRQTTTSADLLATFVDEFNATYDGLPLKIVQSGNYTDIYRKVTASIQAGKLPSMAVAYESMTSEYVRSGAVVSMDTFLDDPETGLSPEELDDFFPAVLGTNVFEELGGKMYSFPYTKSVLMLSFNKRVMAAAGITEPPATWDEFLEQCRAIKSKTGKYAWAVDVDASTIDGMIFSMGGQVYRDGKTLFDSPESLRVFELLETLVREKLVYQNPPRTFNDEPAFAHDEIAFTIRSSSQRPYIAELIEDPEAWGMVRIPQADPEDPHTVLYGANICIFDTTPEQRSAAWAFTKFFTSSEISVRWALGTGYLPFRRSAAEDPAMKAFWAEWPYNSAAFDCLPFAQPEPNVAGWQEVRGLIEKAETAVLSGVMSGRQAALELKAEADAVLALR